MKDLRKLLSRNPEVALGVAVLAGLAIGAGWLPIPSVGSLLPSSPAPQPAAPAAAAPAPAVAPAASSLWD